MGFKWSDSEKKVARRAFDKALEKEYASIMAKFKDMAAKVEKPEDLWAVHNYLTKQQRALDEKYDYRYSELILVFARLLSEKWIDEKDLNGLNPEKLQAIRNLLSW
jgi:Asp-tRNA(Asn)/Glu-tRNA(Gln) amidotransferase B subunit